MSYVLCIKQTRNALTCDNHFPVAHSGFGKGEGLQSEVAASKNFRFSHKKTLILAHLFIEKGCAVSAVTMDNAKIFSQLMSKSRSLDKVREKRLQPVAFAGGGS